MKKKKNVCALCAGTMTRGKTMYTVDLDFGIVVIRNVPAKICAVCGEEWIENKIAKKLEKIIETARSQKSECEILQFSKVPK